MLRKKAKSKNKNKEAIPVTAKKTKRSKKHADNGPDNGVELHTATDDEDTEQAQHDEDAADRETQEPSITTVELMEKLEKSEKEKQELQDKLLRTVAEFDNFKKRVTKEKEDLLRYGIEKFAFELLAIMDNFERALQQALKAESVAPVVEGIEMIRKNFHSVLDKFNIKPFESFGQPFDPERHEAMAQVEHDEHEENTVIDEYQKGYFINDRLLRPARVIVSKSPAKDEDPEDAED